MIRFWDLQGPVSDETLQLASVFERVLQTDSEHVIQRPPCGAAGFESRMRLGKGYIDDGRPDHPLDRQSVLAASLQRSRSSWSRHDVRELEYALWMSPVQHRRASSAKWTAPHLRAASTSCHNRNSADATTVLRMVGVAGLGLNRRRGMKRVRAYNLTVRRLLAAAIFIIFVSLNAIDGICCPDGCTHELQSPSQQHNPEQTGGICVLCLGGVDSSVRQPLLPPNSITDHVGLPPPVQHIDVPLDPLDHPPRS